MKEPYVEGVATHDDPESCVGLRKDVSEALTGALAGRVLSREIMNVRGADVVQRGGRQHGYHRYCEVGVGPARSETPRTRGTFLRENREIPVSSRGKEHGTASGRPEVTRR